jgi:uncharacterized protein
VLNDVPPEGVADASQWSFAGSTLIMVAVSADECRDVLRKDIYATSGVWDVDKAQIMPVSRCFSPFPLTPHQNTRVVVVAPAPW